MKISLSGWDTGSGCCRAGPQLCPGRMGGRAQYGGTGGDHCGAKRIGAPAAISAAEDRFCVT